MADLHATKLRSGLITYDGLPISSGGAHTLRTRGVMDGLAAVRAFLSACTTDPDPELLQVQVTQGGSVPRSVSKALRAEFRHLGWWPIKSRFAGTLTRSWRLPLAEFDDACATIEGHRPIPQTDNGMPAALVAASWRFALVDPETRQVLPHQEADCYLQDPRGGMRRVGESSLYARFSEKTTVNVFLALPFEEAGDAARQYAEMLQRHFPTRFSAGQWRLCRVNKKATGYFSRRVKDFPG